MELWMGVTIVGAWAGSFLGAYLKKKGENLATHEDVNKVVAQMAAVTQTTQAGGALRGDEENLTCEERYRNAARYL
jgi:hypothetical protein